MPYGIDDQGNDMLAGTEWGMPGPFNPRGGANRMAPSAGSGGGRFGMPLQRGPINTRDPAAQFMQQRLGLMNRMQELQKQIQMAQVMGRSPAEISRLGSELSSLQNAMQQISMQEGMWRQQQAANQPRPMRQG